MQNITFSIFNGSTRINRKRLSRRDSRGRFQKGRGRNQKGGFLGALLSSIAGPIIKTVAGPLLGGIFGGGNDSKPAPAPRLQPVYPRPPAPYYPRPQPYYPRPEPYYPRPQRRRLPPPRRRRGPEDGYYR